AAENHVSALRAPLIVGRWRQLARLDEGADHATLEQNGEARTAQTLSERGGEQRHADARENDLSILELARGENRQHFGRRMARSVSHCRCSSRGRTPPEPPP